jgi:hypothetical protein
MKGEVGQPERQDGFLRTGENAGQAQPEQNQAKDCADRKQPVRYHSCPSQAGESQNADDQPARDDQQHVVDDQQVFHCRCLRGAQMSCSTAGSPDEGYPETDSAR